MLAEIHDMQHPIEPQESTCSGRPCRSRLLASVVLIGPTALAAFMVSAIYGLGLSGHERLLHYVPVDALLQGLFYLTPLLFVYTFAVLLKHRRSYSEDFWMTELLFALFPLVILSGFFLLSLCMMGLKGDGVP